MSVTPTANSDLGSFYLVPNYAVRIGDSFDITLVHTLGKFPATAGDRFLFERRCFERICLCRFSSFAALRSRSTQVHCFSCCDL